MVVCKELTEQPEPFDMRFMGPRGRYELSFRPGERPQVEVAGLGGGSLVWWVDRSERRDGGWELSGLTHATKPIWGDVYWFIIHTAGERRVEYWGDRVIVRTDLAVS
ncbi:hypothetical protein [Phenylobacterium sp.]|uniref:hypothetical protein n=1 Tax=Phenylobacterium sp. TaxID=1871053 RepID=UPI003D2D44B5